MIQSHVTFDVERARNDFALPQGKDALNRELGGLQNRSGILENRKVPCLYRNSKPEMPSPYRSRYIDYTTPVDL
jgi:hypothetical protein